MVRAMTLGLAAFLAILWVMGLCEETTAWITWTNGALSLLAVGAAILAPARSGPWRASLPSFLLSTLLLATFLLGLLWPSTEWWIAWWDLVMAFGFLGAAVAGFIQSELPLFRAPRVI